MVIYIDVLLFTNTIINYCILSLTKKYLHLKSKESRLIISSLIASLFTLTVFLPISSTILSMLIKLLCCLSMCIIAFKFINTATYIKAVCTSFVFTLIFSAVMILFYQLCKPENMAIVNDTVYIHVNPLLLIALSVVVYSIIFLLQRLLHKDFINTLVNINLMIDNKVYSCIGKIDTGSSVVEPFSGCPVIITESSVLGDLSLQKPRIVPYSVLGGEGLLYAVKADKVTIDRKEINKDIYIGIYKGEIDPQIKAIINSQIIR